MAEWQLPEGADDAELELDGPVRHAKITLIAGTVDLVSSDGPAHVEVRDVEGPPVRVSLVDGQLTVSQHKDGLLKRVSFGKHSAVVSVALPADTEVEVSVVSAETTVAGFTAPAKVASVSSALFLDDLRGGVKANTVSGELQLRGAHGSLDVHSVSGGVTVMSGTPSLLKAHSVSGDVTLDLSPDGESQLSASTVSGNVVLRAPVGSLGTVNLKSTTGSFDTGDLEMDRHRNSPGHREAWLDGVGASFTASTVSGRIALIDRAG